MITFWPCVLVRSSHTDKQKTQRCCSLFDLNVVREVQMKNFKQIFESAAQSKLGRFFFSPSSHLFPRPRRGVCNSVFSFSLVRGQLSAGAVCVAVREIFFFRGVGLLLETQGLGRRPFAWCLGVSTAESKGEKECGCILSVIGYYSAYICWLEGSGSYKNENNSSMLWGI